MKTISIISGLIGLAVGAIGGFFAAKKYYGELHEKEIDDVVNSFREDRDEYRRKFNELLNEKLEINEEENKVEGGEVTEYSPGKDQKQENKTNYQEYYPSPEAMMAAIKRKNEAPNVEEIVDETRGIKCVPYSDFMEKDGYEHECIFYYADEEYADEDDYRIDKIDEYLGHDPLQWFGYYDDGDPDRAYFVNDQKESYYTLYRSEKKFFGEVEDIYDDDYE